MKSARLKKNIFPVQTMVGIMTESVLEIFLCCWFLWEHAGRTPATQQLPWGNKCRGFPRKQLSLENSSNFPSSKGKEKRLPNGNAFSLFYFRYQVCRALLTYYILILFCLLFEGLCFSYLILEIRWFFHHLPKGREKIILNPTLTFYGFL